MADLKISQLTAISVLTPATDVLPVVDVGGVTKKITTNQILGSGGTATLASATITGAATVGTTLGVTGNLTASSNIYVPASTTFKVGPVAGTWAGLRFDSAKAMVLDSDTTITFRVNGGTSFSTAGSIDTSGNLNLNTGNVVMTTSGKGIDFSATANSSGTMTSELLADYEEGTFTPTFTASAGAPTTVTLNSAAYTKIGRRVSVDVDFTITAIGTASGNLYFTLPFSQSTASTPCGAFVEVSVVGYMGAIFQIDATRAGMNFYNNATTWVNNYRYRGTYTYNV